MILLFIIDPSEAILGVFAFLIGYAFISIPGIIVVWLTWKATSKIKLPLLRTIVHSLISSICLAPTFYGFAGVIPAIWIFLGNPEIRWTLGALPIAIMFVICIPIIHFHLIKRLFDFLDSPARNIN